MQPTCVVGADFFYGEGRKFGGLWAWGNKRRASLLPTSCVPLERLSSIVGIGYSVFLGGEGEGVQKSLNKEARNTLTSISSYLFIIFSLKKGVSLRWIHVLFVTLWKVSICFFIFVHLHCAAFTLKKFYYNFIVSL